VHERLVSIPPLELDKALANGLDAEDRRLLAPALGAGDDRPCAALTRRRADLEDRADLRIGRDLLELRGELVAGNLAREARPSPCDEAPEPLARV
jgi:hypothetical protein